jgi:hypothetical protein
MGSLLFLAFGFIALLCIGIFVPKIIHKILTTKDQQPSWLLVQAPRFLAWGIMAVWFLSLSFVHVPINQVGLLNRIWGTEREQGAVLARTDNQRGPQADILGPGTAFIPFVHVFFDVETVDQFVVPDGYYGLLTARDGDPMPAGQYVAPAWKEGTEKSMLDAKTFLSSGGVKGPQLYVLTPAIYPLNTYLWDAKVIPATAEDRGTQATIIPAGSVGVVKSNVTEPGKVCKEVEEKVDTTTIHNDNALSALLVPKGCTGIWNEVLTPGAYYLNRNAYQITPVDTRVQMLQYQGGYVSRKIELNVGLDGKIEQTETSETVETPTGAADDAINVKVGSWVVHQDLRMVIQISPDNAPIVVGAVGGLKQIEDSIVTPAVQSVVRDVMGGVLNFPGEPAARQVEINDLIVNREFIQGVIEDRIRAEGAKAGLSVREVRLQNPDIPPEMLLGNKREQLAQQMKQAFEQEQTTQEQRIKVEQAKATADQQESLVTAQIGVEVSKLTIDKRTNEGKAEQSYLEALAAGQKAQALVLGEENVLLLNMVDKVLASLGKNPEILGSVRLPSTMVLGSGSFEGVAAIVKDALGGSPRQDAKLPQ